MLASASNHNLVWISAGSNAPVTIDGDYVIAGAGVPLPKNRQNLIIAYKLGATGQLPVTVGPSR